MNENILKRKWKKLKSMPKSGGNITLVRYPASQVLIDHAKTLKEDLSIKANTLYRYVHLKLINN